MSHIRDAYPNAVEHHLEDGSIVFTAEFLIGGIDEAGEYVVILEGPAQGEKCYVS